MKRKTVKHGHSTLSISLPSKWVKINNIQKGQLLNVDFAGKGLVVNPEKPRFSSIEVTLSDEKEWYIHRIFTHLYTHGFDEIKVNYVNRNQLPLIRDSLSELSGFEIVESNQRFCKIKSVTSIDSTELDDTIKRVFWQILSQFDYFIGDMENFNFEMIKETIEIHKVVVRLINLSKRLINKNMIFGTNTSKYAYNFLTGLLNISRAIIYSYDYAKRNSSKLTEKEIGFVKKTLKFYKALSLAYQNLDISGVRSFLDEREEISNESLEILKEKNPAVMHFFLDMLKEFSTISNFIIILNTNRENKTEN